MKFWNVSSRRLRDLSDVLNLIVLVMKDLMAHMKEDNLEVSLLHPTLFLRLVLFTLQIYKISSCGMDFLFTLTACNIDF